jgi:hypothetical protein
MVSRAKMENGGVGGSSGGGEEKIHGELGQKISFSRIGEIQSKVEGRRAIV